MFPRLLSIVVFEKGRESGGYSGEGVLNSLKTLALRERSHVTTAKFRKTSQELIKATAKGFKGRLSKDFVDDRETVI